MLNKSKGNMYPWCDYTWNPIKGKCPHDCIYCYMKRFPRKELRLVEKELETDLGEGNTIFVGSSTDMFADSVPVEWINRVLLHCSAFDNTYLFQSKNPKRFFEFQFPTNTILGTTIEGTMELSMQGLSKAPLLIERVKWLSRVNVSYRAKKMVSIEPITDFDLEVLTEWIRAINPEFVSIGADRKRHKLPEPSAEKLLALIDNLKEFTEIRSKRNLNRILGASQ